MLTALDVVHEKVVPLTLLGLEIAMLVVWPLQMFWPEADTVGVGFTLTT